MRRDLYYDEYLERSSNAVIDLLRNDPQRVLQPSAFAAIEHAGELTSELHLELGGFDVSRRITIEIENVEIAVDDVRVAADSASFHLSWDATTRPALFPSMKAELEIAPMRRRPPLTQLSLAAHYGPPLGVIGFVGDAVIGHRVAEATIHRFVYDLVDRIKQALPEDRSGDSQSEGGRWSRPIRTFGPDHAARGAGS
jgi:hypothetical protein